MQRCQQPQTLKLDFVAISWSNAHLRHQCAGDRVRLPNEIAPVQSIQLNNAMCKVTLRTG